ncbi:MAG: MarR family transcriptional regulator [Azospirillum brasilense]|mgnify:CR=1 FL=1|nr:MAG: MarR family transcriptional regulator [Azospirillum brasilense]
MAPLRAPRPGASMPSAEADLPSADQPPALAAAIRQDEETRPEIHLGGLEEMLGFTLRLAQEASFAAFARRTGQSDLRPGRFAILRIIAANSGLSQTALSTAAGRDKSTLTPALADLEKRGLIQRRRAPQDRRSYALFVTAEGEAVLRELSGHAAAHDAALDALVGPEQREMFLAILRRIAAGIG